MFSSLFNSNRKVNARSSVSEAMTRPAGGARPWPFIASSPPVNRNNTPARRSLSLPQHVGIFADVVGPNPSSQVNRNGNGSVVMNEYGTLSRSNSITEELVANSNNNSPGASSPSQGNFFFDNVRAVNNNNQATN